MTDRTKPPYNGVFTGSIERITEKEMRRLKDENATLKELCRLAWARLDKIDPNAEITQRLFDAFE